MQYGANGQFAGTALLELSDGDNRLVLDHGASGAPVLDCEDYVVAVVSNLILSGTIQWMDRAIRIPTPWQSPNVASVPIQALNEFAQGEMNMSVWAASSMNRGTTRAAKVRKPRSKGHFPVSPNSRLPPKRLYNQQCIGSVDITNTPDYTTENRGCVRTLRSRMSAVFECFTLTLECSPMVIVAHLPHAGRITVTSD